MCFDFPAIPVLRAVDQTQPRRYGLRVKSETNNPAGVVWVERPLGAIASLSFRRPWQVLALTLLLTAVAAVGMSRLKMDTDLIGLLPDDFESVQAVKTLAERLGSIGYVVVVGMDAEPAQLERFAADAMARVEKVQGVRYVDGRRPVQFFKDRALYYADLADLETARDRLKRREKWERKRRNPMYIDLEDAEPPSVAFDDLKAKYESKADQRWLAEQIGETWYIDKENRLVALLARPGARSMDVDFAVEMVRRVEASLEGMDLKSYGPNFRWATTGRYRKKYDQKVQIQKDLGLASALAVLFMLLYLGIHFRRLSAIVLIISPMAAGLLWTLGLAGFAYGALNILTGFIGAILLGIGIDHGIHLLARYDSERAAGLDAPAAVAKAFGSTGRTVVVAALTTLFAFAGVGLSEFRAFREFGILAALGIVLVMVACWTVLPALLALADRWLKPPKLKVVKRSVMAARLPRYAGVVAIAGLIFVVGISSQLGSLRFDFDFEALQDSKLPTFALDRSVNAILGYQQNPIIALTRDVAQEKLAVAALRAQKAKTGDSSGIDFVASVADLVPPDQQAKHAVLKEIHKVLKKVKDESLEPEQQKLRAQALRMTAALPFSREELPIEVKRQFMSVLQGGDEGYVLVFPNIELTDGAAVAALAEEARTATAHLAAPKPVYAGESMILADILLMVHREAVPVLLVTLILVALSMWILLGSWRPALLCFLAAGASLLSTLGLLAIGEIDLNYLNMVMIPVLFGLSVDGAVHLVGRGGTTAMQTVHSEVGRAISGAVLTTMLGFGVLNIADHPGLNSLGLLAVIGMAVGLVVNLVILPAVMTVAERRRRSR